MEMAMTTPVADIFAFDEYPDTSFDAFADPDFLFDPNSCFDFDACTEGWAPRQCRQRKPSRQPPRQMAHQPPRPPILRLSSEMTKRQRLPSQQPSDSQQQKQQSPAAGVQDFPLVLPSIEPGPSEEDDFESLFAELAGP
ncbi:hypothetical protein Ct61P_06574 [Colletotrichum tofieldiae]|nr:hypothetical protein Ct61P_06574 [Colletotrichum tofieldiae]